MKYYIIYTYDKFLLKKIKIIKIYWKMNIQEAKIN